MNEAEIIENKITELVAEVSKFNTESLAGFFAYFIKRHPNSIVDIELKKFDSKLLLSEIIF